MCPRLRGQIADLRRMYHHVGKGHVKRLKREHSCPECSGFTIPTYTPRDPLQETNP